MITGDYPATAAAIGRKIGLPAQTQIMTGAEIERIHEGDLRRRIGDTAIFARVLPEQKLDSGRSVQSQRRSRRDDRRRRQ